MTGKASTRKMPMIPASSRIEFPSQRSHRMVNSGGNLTKILPWLKEMSPIALKTKMNPPNPLKTFTSIKDKTLEGEVLTWRSAISIQSMIKFQVFSVWSAKNDKKKRTKLHSAKFLKDSQRISENLPILA